MNTKLQVIQNELNVPKSQHNSFGGYDYRSCEDILNAVKPLLKEQKLSMIITDELVNIGDRYYIKATVTVTDGEKEMISTGYAREEEHKKGMDGSQITGASSSYARKYALNGLFLIDDTKDSDTTNKHEQSEEKKSVSPANAGKGCTEKQRKLIYLLYKKKNGEEMPTENRETIRKLTIQKASEMIDKWNKELDKIPEKDVNDTPPEQTVITSDDDIDINDIPFN